MKRIHRPATLLALIATAAVLAACGKPDNQTAGQKLDNAVADVKQAGAEVRADAGAMVKDAKQAAGNAATSVADTARDLAITAKVNAELAKDSQLSAVSINVDTTDGRVALKGTAPDMASRDRATALVAALEGVKSVDNKLEVKSTKG